MCSTYFVEYKDYQKESILNGIRDTAISGADYVSKFNKLNTKNLNEFKANLIKTDSIGISSLGLWGIYLGLYRIPRIYDKFNTRAWSSFLKNFDRFKVDNTYYYKCIPDFNKFGPESIKNIKTKHILHENVLKNITEKMLDQNFKNHPLELVGSLILLYFNTMDYSVNLFSKDITYLHLIYSDYLEWINQNFPEFKEFKTRYSQFVSYTSYMGYPVYYNKDKEILMVGLS